ncbi:MAG: glycosyl hydrolase [Planctomycetota bacterium]|nr:MAG: glycosyl hydrolase [Planctomycetota bacterium]
MLPSALAWLCLVAASLAPDNAGNQAEKAQSKAPSKVSLAQPGFSIPQFDLSSDQSLRSLVDREAGQYLGHPTTVLLEDGKTMLCVYPKGHGRGPIVLKRSTDGGHSWSERLPVPKSWASSKETPTIHRVVDGDGTKRLILFSGLYPIRMASSEDDGASWSELSPIGDFGGIVAMSSVMRLKDGRYAAWFHDDGRFIHGLGRREKAPVFTVYQSLSGDGGRSWSPPSIVCRMREIHLCEPGAIRSPDGTCIALLLRENARKKNSHVVFSTDEGASWTEPRELPAALTGDRHTACYTKDGRLFVTFRDTGLSSKTQGDWVAWVGSWKDIIEGSEGQYRLRLMDNKHSWDCAYPGLVRLPSGCLVTTTYGHWDKGQPPYIVTLHLRLAELEKRLLIGHK